MIGPIIKHETSVLSDGQEIYGAFQTEVPTWVNIRRFSSVKFAFPKGEMKWCDSAPIVYEKSREHANSNLASVGWMGVNALDGTANGKTMIICGSGRSLVSVAHKVKKSPGIVVVALNGALKAMPEDSVDIYFTLDWKGDPAWYSGVDWETEHPGIVGVFGLPSPPDLIPLFSKRYYFPANYVLPEPEKAEAFAIQYGFLAESLCATHSAMHLAYRMGVTKIILIGHDFACTDLYQHWNKRLQSDYAGSSGFLFTNDIHGNAVPTTHLMVANAHVVSATASACKDDGITVINATEGGILGLPLSMPLDQALAYEAVPCLT